MLQPFMELHVTILYGIACYNHIWNCMLQPAWNSSRILYYSYKFTRLHIDGEFSVHVGHQVITFVNTEIDSSTFESRFSRKKQQQKVVILLHSSVDLTSRVYLGVYVPILVMTVFTTRQFYNLTMYVTT